MLQKHVGLLGLAIQTINHDGFWLQVVFKKKIFLSGIWPPPIIPDTTSYQVGTVPIYGTVGTYLFCMTAYCYKR